MRPQRPRNRLDFGILESNAKESPFGLAISDGAVIFLNAELLFHSLPKAISKLSF
jgi:hypothetical protein